MLKKASSIEIHLLGPFRVFVDDQAIDERRFTRRKPKQLLKLLALQPHHQLLREQAMEFLWPESDPESAANNLHKAIHLARHALEPSLKSVADSHFILTQGPHVLLKAPGELWIDVEEFERRAAATSKSADLKGFEAACKLYEGDLLSEDLYEDWAAPRREQLSKTYQELLAKLATLYEERAEHKQAIDLLSELAATDSSNEETHRRLMRLYAVTGNKHQALRQYDLCRQILQQEFGVAPEPSTRTLHQQIVSGQVVPLSAARATGSQADTTGNSLAILPLVNASADANAEYLSDGITESVINNLSQLPGLTVMAWNTVSRFKGSKTDPQVAGRALGVRAVLTGRVLELGDRLVIKTELVSVADGSQLWGESYNRQLADIFVIEEEISREISDKLRLKLTGDEQRRLAKRYTDNLEAYHAYLKGRYYWNKRTDKDVRRGLEYFKQAIDRDPCYALAYAGLADSYIILGMFGLSSLSPGEAFPKAKEAAVKALEIDDTLAEAHASLALALGQHDWDWANAEGEFKRAIELKPTYATAHHWYAFVYLTAMGRLEEAIAEESRAQELEPLSLIISTNLGTLLYLARRYDEATDQYRKAFELDANFTIAHWMLGLVYEQKSMFAESIVEFQKAVALPAALLYQ
jgi:DNA-binding SARP family transcriptional activator